MRLCIMMIAICLAFALILSGLSIMVFRQATELNALQQQLMDTLRAGDIMSAQILWSQLHSRWHQVRPFWKTVLEHEDLDEVDDLLTDIDAAFYVSENSEALYAAGRLGNHLYCIREQMQILWYNLL